MTAQSRPTIRRGDQGTLVVDLQTCLLLPPEVDGDFGPQTEHAVRSYQVKERISVDGVVGPTTWSHLEEDYELPPYPPGLLPPLDPAVVAKIEAFAMASPVATYQWNDRGESPPGYVKGMARGWATLVRKLHAGDSAALDMAQAASNDTDTDALAWYTDAYDDLDMDNDDDGIVTLRHLYMLIWGLGMRESSGEHCCGRDQSADNTTSETCEAGLYQQSYNSCSCSTEIQRLLDQYGANLGSQQCALDAFKEGVSCSDADWSCYGDGMGYEFQETAKHCPQFAVEACGIALRHLRQHFGPINRLEVELNPSVDKLCQQIERLL